MNCLRLPLFAELEGSRSILIAGAGGGFDIFSGLPLFFGLRAAGKRVHLANLSFSHLEAATGRQLAPAALEVFYWCFRLGPVARRVLYLDDVKQTRTAWDLIETIDAFRRRCPAVRERAVIPEPASTAGCRGEGRVGG